MISDDELLYLPDDPELAFVQFEKSQRQVLYQELETSTGYNSDILYIEYINHVIASARALDLDILRDWAVPSTSGQIFEVFGRFSADVDHYTVQVRIRHARRLKRYSVALDPNTKRKLRHHLSSFRETVDRLEIPAKKKDAFYKKIAALELEIDRTRLPWDAVLDLVLETSDRSSEVVQRLEPLRKLIDSVTGLLKAAKDDEDERSPNLPAPEERRGVEGPRKQLAAPTTQESEGSLDDEIPF